jgi:hypothetical protein
MAANKVFLALYIPLTFAVFFGASSLPRVNEFPLMYPADCRLLSGPYRFGSVDVPLGPQLRGTGTGSAKIIAPSCVA